MVGKLCVLRVQARLYAPTILIFAFGFYWLWSALTAQTHTIVSHWILPAAFLVLGMQLPLAFWFYRVELSEDALVERRLQRRTEVPLAAIVRLQAETGGVGISVKRPKRRIAVYYVAGGGEQFLDISLIHFSVPDVQNLLHELLRLRPDLAMPDGFSGAEILEFKPQSKGASS